LKINWQSPEAWNPYATPSMWSMASANLFMNPGSYDVNKLVRMWMDPVGYLYATQSKAKDKASKEAQSR